MRYISCYTVSYGDSMVQEKSNSTPPPLISIIIPVYNVEEYLEECIESVCNQTLKEIEIICIDDGSTDRSGTLLDEYAMRDKRIVVIHSPNRGLSAARNLGLKHARAEYISFLDSDDYIAPTMCEVLYTAMIEHDIDTAMCGISVVCEEGQEYRNKHSSYYIEDKSGLYPMNVNVMANTIVVVYAKILKKSLLDRFGIRFLEGKVHEDMHFTYAYLSVTRNIYVIQENLLFRRIRENSITDISHKGYNSQHIDSLEQLAYLFDFWNTLGILESVAGFFWSTYLSTIYTIARTLRYRYLHILLHVAGTFIMEHQETIPTDDEFLPQREMLLEYIAYKDATIRDVAVLLRKMRKEQAPA